MYAYSSLFFLTSEFSSIDFFPFYLSLTFHLYNTMHPITYVYHLNSSFHFFLNLKTPTEEQPAERTLADVLEEDDEFEEFEQEHWGKAQEEEGDAKQWQDNWGRFFINLKLQKLADTCIKKATHIYLSIFSTFDFVLCIPSKNISSLFLVSCPGIQSITTISKFETTS